MRLIFVRHGEPDYQKDCLTANGRIQAADTAKRLKDEGITAIYSSPMGRARETASYTAQEYGLDIQILDFMHEINWGDADGNQAEKLEYEGHPWTLACKLLSENPGYVGSPGWSEHHYFRDNVCMDYYTKISGEFDGFLAGFGLVRQDKLYRCTEDRAETIALFAHGGSGAIMFSHLLNLSFPFVLTAMPYGVCSVSVIEFKPQFGDKIIPRLELFNDMGHIDKMKVEKLCFEK